MHTYEVGKPYSPNRRHWPEQTQWRWSTRGTELVMFYRSPKPEEIQSVRSGAARFALLAGDHALILAHRFDPQPWADTPWQACRQSDATPGVPAVAAGEQLLVTVLLVDANDGLIQAIRVLSWPPKFVAAVRDAIATQLENRSTDTQGGTEIDAWYRRYPTTAKLVKAADLNIRV